MSQYPVVTQFMEDLINIINNPELIPEHLKQQNKYFKRSNDSMITQYEAISSKYGEHRTGSGRYVIILPEHEIVIKVPINKSGYDQNIREYECSNDSDYTDVLESHELFNLPHFVLVNPYYKPVMDLFDEFVSDILNEYPDNVDIHEVFSFDNLETYGETHDGVEYDLYSYATLNVNDPFVSKCGSESDSAIENFWEKFDDLHFASYISENFSGWIDKNIDNFGVTQDGLYIILDAGLQSDQDLHSNNLQENGKDFVVSDLTNKKPESSGLI